MNVRHLTICTLLALPLAACSKSGQNAALPAAEPSSRVGAQDLAQEDPANTPSDVQVPDALQFEVKPGIRGNYQQCIDNTGGVTPDMQDCISEEYAYQDQRLNATYAQLLEVLNDDKDQMLRDAQRQWNTKRDLDCAPEGAPGQGQVLMANDCALQMTADRADELQNMLSSLAADK